MPFGLVSVPAAFQKTMATILRDLNWKQVLIYVDDVLVMCSTFYEHLRHLQQVFDRLCSAKLTLIPSKCQFAAKELVYLGYVISKEGIRLETRNKLGRKWVFSTFTVDLYKGSFR